MLLTPYLPDKAENCGLYFYSVVPTGDSSRLRVKTAVSTLQMIQNDERGRFEEYVPKSPSQ